MCLAIPGKLIERYDDNGLAMGRVDYDGTVQTACLVCVPEVTIGDYVLVHAGFAISVIDAAEAERTLAMWQQLAEQERTE